jgi:hypothetical protein
MRNYQEKFPELHQFLSGLFHQDWLHVFDWKGQKPNYKGVVRDAKTRENEAYLGRCKRELKDFLNLELTESEVEDVMDDWNIAYYPYGGNLTYIEWLRDVLEILEETSEKTKKEFIPEFIG